MPPIDGLRSHVMAVDDVCPSWTLSRQALRGAGGGLAGLARMRSAHGHQAEVFEMADTVGTVCCDTEGFVMDRLNAGCVIHTGARIQHVAFMIGYEQDGQTKRVRMTCDYGAGTQKRARCWQMS
ncbi:MAG: hypothetical protein ACLS7Z_06725 [Christensenellales bacterium]